METARGSPSGIATINIHTARIASFTALSTVSFDMRLRVLSNKIMATRNTSCVAMIKRAMIMAYLVRVWERASSFSSKNVCYSLIIKSWGFLVMASLVSLPTAHTMALPEPVMIIDPDNKKGSGCSLWLSYSLSYSSPCVKLSDFSTAVSLALYIDSSTVILVSSTSTQSAGTLSPYWISITSPTTRSRIGTEMVDPYWPLKTIACALLISSLIFKYCLSLIQSAVPAIKDAKNTPQ